MIEVLKQVVQALEEAQTNDDGMEKWDRNKKAITSLCQIIAELESQEPDFKILSDLLQQEVDRLIAARLVQRPWVGLTDVEWMNIVNKDRAWFGQRPDEVAHAVAKLIEAKLKDMNT